MLGGVAASCVEVGFGLRETCSILHDQLEQWAARKVFVGASDNVTRVVVAFRHAEDLFAAWEDGLGRCKLNPSLVCVGGELVDDIEVRRVG